MSNRSTHLTLGAVLLAFFALLWSATARAADPIKIGFSTSLTGGLASSGKANLLAQQIWADQINAKGGLLGRQVTLDYYDDQSKADTVDVYKRQASVQPDGAAAGLPKIEGQPTPTQ